MPRIYCAKISGHSVMPISGRWMTNVHNGKCILKWVYTALEMDIVCGADNRRSRKAPWVLYDPTLPPWFVRSFHILRSPESVLCTRWMIQGKDRISQRCISWAKSLWLGAAGTLIYNYAHTPCVSEERYLFNFQLIIYIIAWMQHHPL